MAGSIELPHNLLAIRPWVSSNPITLVKVEQPMNVWNSMQTPREDSIICHWPTTHHLLSSPTIGVGSSFRGEGMNSKLVASSDEAAWSFSPDPVDDLALDPAAWANSDREEWADSEPEAWAD
ncbi:hypothetical protein H5410_037270, partial [Solanum commersonii]